MDAVLRRSKLVLAALVLALLALTGLAADTLVNERTAETRPFELVLLACAGAGLVCVIVMIFRGRTVAPADDDEPPIDLRERLGPYVDLDDRGIDREMGVRA
jgi:drug/metabolite transporter (DMT)-like permease